MIHRDPEDPPIRRWLLSMTEIPTILLPISFIFLALKVVQGGEFWLSYAVSLVIGALGVAWGIKTGRRQIIRRIEFQRAVAASEVLPEMIEFVAEQGAPDEVMDLMRAELREAKEHIARETK